MTVCIGFTGTEFGGGMIAAQAAEVRTLLLEALATHKNLLARHGDCVGADAQFHEICIGMNIPIVLHPPINDRKRAYCQGALSVEPAKTYLDRNDDIARCCDLLIAAPRENREIVRSGVWATVRCARKHKKQIAIVYPMGDVDLEVEE